MTTFNLERFLRITQEEYEIAFAEITNGKKKSHWMSYIFPQIEGVDPSEMSVRYAIKDLSEAEEFLKDRKLLNRLIAVCNAIIMHEDKPINEILGRPDDEKLKSSMTLFSLVPNASPVFQLVLDLFFKGEKDFTIIKKIQLNA